MFFNYLFEISWEVCNKVGGINTVISSKSIQAKRNFDNYILMGPYLKEKSDEFEECDLRDEFKQAAKELEDIGIRLHFGKWKSIDVEAILIEYLRFSENINEIKGKLWEVYKIDSLNSSWYDYDEALLWSWCCGIVIEKLMADSDERCIVHAHEWMAGGSIFYIKSLENNSKYKTVFTTHATMLGRALSGNGFNIYKDSMEFEPDKKAYEIGVHTKHQSEKALAHISDSFTTVSDITSKEAENFYGKIPDNILYNGFETFPEVDIDEILKKKYESRNKLEEFIKGYFYNAYDVNPQAGKIFYTSGRNEFLNKGVDVYIDALGELNKKLTEENFTGEVFNLFLIPIGEFEKDPLVIDSIKKYNEGITEGRFEVVAPLSTHKLDISNEIINRLLSNDLSNKKEDKIKIIIIPQYLNGNDGFLNRQYYDVIRGTDLGIFASLYEPWGYTPLESIAFGVASVTSDLAGFGRYLNENGACECVRVLQREGKNHSEAVEELVNILYEFSKKSDEELEEIRKKSRDMANRFDWEKFYERYMQVYEILLK